MDIRAKVEYLLKIQGKQKKDLAKYLSINQGNLNRTLLGTSIEKENKIAEFFHITREELIINDYSDVITPSNSQDENLVQLIHNNTILAETNGKLVDKILELMQKGTESDIAGAV